MKPIAFDSTDDQALWPRPPWTGRRRFLAMTLGLGLGAPLIRSIPVRQAGRSRAPEVHLPFSPVRTVVLPRRLGRPHVPARRVIERRVEELAAMDLFRLPEPKIDALLQVAAAVTSHYGLADRLPIWAERVPVQEAFTPGSYQHAGLLTHWQPREPVPGARDRMDWWLFLSPRPIDWGSLDDLPVHALIAHVAPEDYSRRREMWQTWKQASDLIGLVADSDLPWPAVSRMRPAAAVRHLNAIASRNRLTERGY